MAERARVESVEALKKFRAALCKFAESVDSGLGEAEAEIQRTAHWLTHEQRNYWKRQLERRSEVYARAKGALNRKKMEKTPLGGRYSCVDEEKALAAAARRLEEAKQKQANVQRWSRVLDEESFTYRASTQGLSQATVVEIPTALAQLDNMVAAIEAYAVSTAPSEQRSTAPTAAADVRDAGESASMARATPAAHDAAAEASQRLRARTPDQSVRDEALLATPAPPTAQETESPEETTPPERAAPPVASGADLREVFARLDQASTPAAADDRIVVARGAARYERIYLERIASAPAGDSGWYCGYADDTEVAGYDAVRVADFVAGRPELAPALELPVGCLVVLDGASLAAVLDAQNRLLWSTTQRAGRTDD